MPTMSADRQAVLATDRVRFQGQEVAFVIADDHYSARDALELIDVDYDPLPVVVDPRAALEPGAPLVRDGGNRVFDWEAGDAAATAAAFARADVVVEQEMLFPRVHPAPLETCGAVADYDRVERQADDLVHDPGAARPPHAVLAHHRPAGAQDPRDLAGRRRRVRQQGPDLPRLPVRGRGRAEPRPAGQVGRGPLREPDVDRVRARLRDDGADRGHVATAGSWPWRST